MYRMCMLMYMYDMCTCCPRGKYNEARSSKVGTKMRSERRSELNTL